MTDHAERRGRNPGQGAWSTSSDRPWRRALRWWGYGGVVCAAGVLGARQWGLTGGPLVAVVAFIPWVVWATPALVVVGWLARARLLVAAAAVMVVAGMATQVPLLTSSSSSGPAEWTVASINATFGRVDPAEVVALVRDEEVDLLAVQELTPASVNRLQEAGLGDLLPYVEDQSAEGFAGIGLWSAVPLDDAAVLPGLTAQTVRARISLGGAPVTVIAAHPAAPGIVEHRLWERDLVGLREVVRAQSGPVMVVGDLNASRDHAPIRDLERDGCADAADQAGALWKFTFPQGRGAFPAVAIDHVMECGTAWVASRVDTVTLSGADHRALVVDYSPR